jgi:Tol biopolymer transport system component
VDRELGIEARTIVAWTPDGSGFLIHATRQGISGFWHVPISQEGQAGNPSLVRGGIPFALTAGRMGDSFYYYIPVEGPRLFQASVDLDRGTLLSAPTPLTPISYVRVSGPRWSPDGRQMAYAVMDADRNWSVHLRSADGNEVTSLADLGQVRGVQCFTWAADGSALYYSTYAGDQRHLHRTDVRTGVTEEIHVAPPDQGPMPIYVTPDGVQALIARGFPQVEAEGGVPTGLMLRNLETGEETVISDTPPESMRLSPDGSTIAGLVTDETGRYRTLYLQPVNGGYPTVLVEHDREEGAIQSRTGLSWSRDGQYILTTYWTAASGDLPERFHLTAYPVNGGEPITFGEVVNPGASPDLHPDGRRVAYVDGYLKGEIWVMEGWK